MMKKRVLAGGARAFGAALLLLGACATETPPPRLAAAGTLGAGPLPSPLPLRSASPIAASLPPALPMTVSGSDTAESALGTVLVGAGGAVLGGVLATGYCLPLGLFAVACAPFGAGLGMVGGGQEGASSIARSQGQRQAVEAAAVLRAFAERLDGARLAACLERTLLERAGGRLLPAGAAEPTVLETRLVLLQVRHPETRPPAEFGVDMAIAASVQRAGVAGEGRVFTWEGAPRTARAWATAPAEILETELQTAIGLVAQRLLAELFPDAIVAPSADAPPETYRASCGAPAPLVEAGPAAPPPGG